MKMDSVHGTVNGTNVVTGEIRRDYFNVFTSWCLSRKVSIGIFSPAGVTFTHRAFNIHIAGLQDYQTKAFCCF